LAEGDRVRLTCDLREQGRLYAAGSSGTIVHVHRVGGAFEVEITHPCHYVVTVEPESLEALPN
jgi:hypothetical protein